MNKYLVAVYNKFKDTLRQELIEADSDFSAACKCVGGLESNYPMQSVANINYIHGADDFLVNTYELSRTNQLA